MAEVVKKVDLRTRVERTNYFKQSYITNTQLGMLQLKSSYWILFLYLWLWFVFLYLVFLETKDAKLMFSVPLLYVGLLIYVIGFYFFWRWKTTLRGVRRIYEIIGDYFIIAKDNSNHSYNEKNKVCANELKEIKITI